MSVMRACSGVPPIAAMSEMVRASAFLPMSDGGVFGKKCRPSTTQSHFSSISVSALHSTMAQSSPAPSIREELVVNRGKIFFNSPSSPSWLMVVVSDIFGIKDG